MENETEEQYLIRLDKYVEEENLKPTFQCSCGWKSSIGINRITLMIVPYTPLFITSIAGKIGWVCPGCKKINTLDSTEKK